MKCPNCGGEVDSQNAICPYCNSIHEPGRLFQFEMSEKRERNRLLPKFILKNRTSDMVQMLLTRIIISCSLAAVVFTAVAFGIYWIGEDSVHREPEEGTYAWKYMNESDKRVENEMLREYMNEIVIAIDTGEEIEPDDLHYVLLNSVFVFREKPDSGESQIIRAFMSGYLQMTEEEITYFTAEREDYSEIVEESEALTAKLLLRLGGGE